MISIYTHTNNPTKKEFWKWLVKKAIKKYSGPDAVLDSLIRGLTELNIPFEINPLKPKYSTIHVLSGVEELKDAIKHKKINQTLIAGPTIVTTPDDQDKILLDNKIDIILTPSKWVTDLYVSLFPELNKKILSWPAGVEIPSENYKKNGDILLFKKNISNEVFEKVKKVLDEQKVHYSIFEYGKFSHKDYIEKLKSISYMIYLQKSESQGIALQEAWAYNVPTLVYQNTTWTYKTHTWNDLSLSAPYLTSQSGLFFSLETFKDIMLKLKTYTFEPKEYCLNKLSDLQSAKILVNIIKNYYEKIH
jgi:hypothetical protein